MKDFVKWLGVNEKIAKVIVWLLIIMVMLILTNTMLESIGFPYYAITYDNLIKINVNKVFDMFIAMIVSILNFYSIALLVFKVKETKRLFKFSVLYFIINWIIQETCGYIAMQIFIIVFDIVFCYLYSGKKAKYILYTIAAYIVTTIVQSVWYNFKMKFISYPNLNYTTRTLLSLDYYIIMAVIILVKEIYLKKRGKKNVRNTRMYLVDGRIQKRKQIRKETSKKSSKSSKISK